MDGRLVHQEVHPDYRSQRDPPVFTPQTSGTSQGLNDIEMLDLHTGLVVGNASTNFKRLRMWCYLGGPGTAGITTDLNGVSFVDTNLGWAVGVEASSVTSDGGSIGFEVSWHKPQTWAVSICGCSVAMLWERMV